MGITKFFYLLSAFCLAIILYDIDQTGTKTEENEKPLVSFYDTVMYNIDAEHVNNIIPSQEAYFYESREEMVKGTIVSRSNDKKLSKNTNTVSADYMVKIGDEVYLDGDVNLESADGMSLQTEQLQYNLKSRIAQNKQKFVARKDFHDFYGTHLYYDDIKQYLRARDTHFNIKVTNE